MLLTYIAAFTAFLLLLLVPAADLVAQERVLSDKEMHAITRKAYPEDGKKPFKSLTFTQMFDKNTGKGRGPLSTTHEFVDEDRQRWFNVAPGDDYIDQSEEIWFLEKKYFRYIGERWKIETRQDYIDRKRGIRMLTAELSRPATNKFLRRETLNGRQVDVYESVITNTFISQGVRNTEIETSYYWIGDDGYFAKIVKEYDKEPGGTLQHVTTTYDFDASVKVERPVVPKMKKGRR